MFNVIGKCRLENRSKVSHFLHGQKTVCSDSVTGHWTLAIILHNLFVQNHFYQLSLPPASSAAESRTDTSVGLFVISKHSGGKCECAMKTTRLLRRLRNDPKYLCKYLVWTNVLCFLYFTLTTDNHHISENEIDQTKEEETDEHKDFKFKDFDLNKWREAEHYQLNDSNEIHFK